MSDNERNKRFYSGLGYRSVGVTVFAEKKLRPAGYFVVRDQGADLRQSGREQW